MGQEPATTPAEGQAPEAPPTNEGQAPAEPAKSEPTTFDRDYVEKLRGENAAARKARQELEAKLTEFEERDKSELEKLTGKVTKAEQRAQEAEARLLRYEVASEKEVPAKLVPLLTATTREDLEAQATLILENAKPAAPEFDGGPREIAPEPQTPEQRLNNVALQALGIQPTK